MKFHSGFALLNEEEYFHPFLDHHDYGIAGFSYGAIKALQDVLNSPKRIDRLILLSPAFFQTKKEGYKKLQTSGFLKDKNSYIEKFLENCFSPCPAQKVEINPNAALEELEELLYFEWTPQIMQELKDKKIDIEVYLGSEDRIIDSASAREFFVPYATVTMIKGANHFLQQC